MTQTQECVDIAHTEAYRVIPKTGEIILPPRSDVPAEDLPPPDDIFFYGWRFVEHRVNGTTATARMPLTREDVLHPQPEDRVSQNKKHFELCNDLYDGMKAHVAHEQGTVVLHDMLIHWGIEDLKHAPDLAVIRGVKKFFEEGIFDFQESQGYVVLLLEVTSPSTWDTDVDGKRIPNKVQEYAQAGAAIYILIHAVKWVEGCPPPIIVYLLGADGEYHEQTADARGWYWIEPLQVWIGPYQDWVAWYDKDENKLNTHVESEQARKFAEDKARLAEDKVREEAEARKLAEEKSRLAEDKRREEAEARKLAEDRIRELEALLAATKNP